MSKDVLRLHLEGFARKTATRTEADVQLAIAAYLTVSEIGLAPSQVSKVEEQLRDGTQRRIDISYGSIVIEVKKDLSATKVLPNTIKQLEGYLTSRKAKEGKNYAGIITDGLDWKLYYLGVGGIEEVDSVRVDVDNEKAVDNLNKWLQTILLTGERLRVTPERIVEKLGAESPRFKLAKAQLRTLYENAENGEELKTKRGLWARLLRTALGTSFEDSLELFIDHTLLVIEAELIAHLVLGVNPNDHSPEEVISGAIFRRSGIFNVVAQDFFDWVGGSEDGRALVKSLTLELQQFDWTDIDHDVLKSLYEAVIDKETRKGLGEYYTPDWLAEKVIEELDINWTESRSMDPSCGSGTFVFHAIRKFIDAGESKGWSNPKIIEELQKRVFGLDIHPVSVVLARVTYLLAIGSERLASRGSLTVPIYLGDSMQWTRGANLMGQSHLRVDVEASDLAGDFSETMTTLFASESVLDFPIRVVSEPAEFDRLVNELATLAQTYTDFSKKLPRIEPVLKQFKIFDETEVATLTATFKTLCTLNAEGRDHIWGYFVRNQVRPVWFSLEENRVDYLFGNPPWVAYRFMTESMQKGFKALSENRNLWAGGKVSTHQDLVALFIARTVEQFLGPDGKFGFVVPFAVLSRLQYEGFRTGKWADSAPDGIEGETQRVTVSFRKPWDLSEVKPAIFPVPSAVVYGSKSASAVPLPEETVVASGDGSETIAFSQGLTKQLSASDASESPFRSLAMQGAILTPRVLLVVDRESAKGSLGSPLGQISVRSQRSNLEKEPWKSATTLVGSVESDFIFKVLTGSSIAPFRILSEWEAVLPIQDGRILDSEVLESEAPMTTRWWRNAEDVWDSLKGKSKLSFLENIDYQGKLTKQLPAYSQRVVYTTSGTKLCACFLEDSTHIIDTKLYWVRVDGKEEGHYLAALLNSNVVQDQVRGMQSLGLFGPRDFHTLPLNLPIQRFDRNVPQHRLLAELGARAANLLRSLEIDEPESFVKARKIVQLELTKELQGQIDDVAAETLGNS
jgi:hypothetical protein